MNASLCPLLAAAALLCCATAHAATPDVQFVWEKPPGSLCPSRAVLQADVEDAMGRRVFGDEETARVIIRGTVEDRADEVRVRLEAHTASGTTIGSRELTAEPGQCAALRGAIGLVLTLFVESDEGLTSTPHIELGFGAAVSGASTPLPRFALALGPSMLVEIDHEVQLHATAAYWPPVSIHTADGVGATVDAFSLALRACARIWAGLGLCAGFEAGALVAKPLQLNGPARQVRLLAHGLVDARWEVPLGSAVRAQLAAGPLLSLSRPQVSYVRADGRTVDVYRPQLGGIILQLTIIILDA